MIKNQFLKKKSKKNQSQDHTKGYTHEKSQLINKQHKPKYHLSKDPHILKIDLLFYLFIYLFIT
jgi:hypothetical protein